MRFWKYEGLGNDFVLWFGDEERRRGSESELNRKGDGDEAQKDEVKRREEERTNLIQDHRVGRDLGRAMIGNDIEDFISLSDLTPSLIQRICHRHTGVGADGIIIFLSGHPSQSDPNYRIKIFNSDGSCAIMCGNGLRCVIKMISDLEDQLDHQSQRQQCKSYAVMTDAGMVSAQVSSVFGNLS